MGISERVEKMEVLLLFSVLGIFIGTGGWLFHKTKGHGFRQAMLPAGLAIVSGPIIVISAVLLPTGSLNVISAMGIASIAWVSGFGLLFRRTGDLPYTIVFMIFLPVIGFLLAIWWALRVHSEHKSTYKKMDYYIGERF